ncbi:hypothetical protein BZG82_01705 [Salinivibrio sp. PR5]|uniref:D-hexose-6-phosphate mutarotase n=1 Tax=Salinivibrio sp. PR5 TaxID=1909484 RepID=UPI00098BC822|nr:D-hexose-6-phosphate mutarotase [Salinivibrio sp. PR5]OOF12170.1 hypothetical protein BZG82_01705 [Salinivibrio sp. PR5]
MTSHTLHFERRLSASVDLCYRQAVPVLRIQHPACDATISQFGAHLLSFSPRDAEPLIWMSGNAVYDAKTPLRGGIPVCFPWFGQTGSPSHGFARRVMWNIQHIEENTQGVTIQLSLTPSETTRALWPHDFEAVMTFTLTQTLDVALTVKNTDSLPFEFGGALHSYLSVADSEQATVAGVGSHYLDNFSHGQRKPASGTVTFEEPVDRIYTDSASSLTLTDTAGYRRIVVNNQGETSAVVWNPGQAASVQMSDMDDDGYLHFVCIEAAIEQPSIQLAPGESHTLNTCIHDEKHGELLL